MIYITVQGRFFEKSSTGRASHIGLLAAGSIVMLMISLIIQPVTILAQPPPEYTTISRIQRLEHTPDNDDLMRIWIVDVGQGDGIIIQLPPKYNYELDWEGYSVMERIDIAIDGGSWEKHNGELLGKFFDKLYPDGNPVIEYAVISHHDKDHILGLINILENTDIIVRDIYHNGLATYRPGKKGFPAGSIPTSNAIVPKSSKKLTRGMAFLDSQGRMKREYVIENLNQLKTSYRNSDFKGIYEDLAEAVINQSGTGGLESFNRAYAGADFVIENEESYDNDLTGLEIEVIWPLEKLHAYASRNWGKTINGNSVTFRLVYGHFEMLFTGDLNKASQKELVAHLRNSNQMGKLSCDVLKVPHHGSSDVLDELFGDPNYDPVISVAAMGDHGFKPSGHKHPRPEIVDKLGGPHRFFSTHIHEKKFKWSKMGNADKRNRMIEKTRKDILIETDGEWFRVVEVKRTGDPNYPPSVDEVRRGHGTRWIQGSKGGQ